MRYKLLEIIIATRKSELAQIQANRVGDLLHNQNIKSKNLLIVTEGDKRLDVTLDKIGGKGLFTKEVELALLQGKADIAVHSMKDVPYEISDKFEIVAIPEREDVRDVFISRLNIPFNQLRKGAVIGTSSIRRAAQLKELRPDLIIEAIRGNVNTRLAKMEDLKFDGIILAAAGIKRLGLLDIITDYFDPKVFLPAIGQGALGVECLKEYQYKSILKSIDNKEVRLKVEAERSFMKALNGDCHTLIGAHTIVNKDRLYMIGTSIVNGRVMKDEIEGPIEDNILLGTQLGKNLLSKWR